METVSEKKTRETLEKLEAEKKQINRERNARLRQQAIDAQTAQRNAPKASPVEEAPPVETTPVPVISEEEEYKKNRPRYFKK